MYVVTVRLFGSGGDRTSGVTAVQRRCGTGWVVLLLAAGAPAQEGGTLEADVPVSFVRTIDATIEQVLRGVPVPVLKPGVVVPTIKPPALRGADVAPVVPRLPAGPLPELLAPIVLPPPTVAVVAPVPSLLTIQPPRVGFAAGAAAALARLRAGDASPEVLAALAGLRREALLDLLRRVPLRELHGAEADGLVTALVEGHGFTARDTADRTVTLLYAAWLARRADERCVPLVEALLAARTAPGVGPVPEVAVLACFHERRGDWPAAAAAWQRTAAYTVTIEAIRTWSRRLATCAAVATARRPAPSAPGSPGAGTGGRPACSGTTRRRRWRLTASSTRPWRCWTSRWPAGMRSRCASRS